MILFDPAASPHTAVVPSYIVPVLQNIQQQQNFHLKTTINNSIDRQAMGYYDDDDDDDVTLMILLPFELTKRERSNVIEA